MFAPFYQRFGSIAPLLVTHTAIDVVAFRGHAELAGHMSRVPTAGESACSVIAHAAARQPLSNGWR
jgi:hypothetical protein